MLNRIRSPLSAPHAGALTVVAALGLAGLTACGGGKGPSGDAQATPAASAASPAQASAATPAADSTAAQGPNGQQLYQRCAVCHQATGQGVPGAFPPLAGSEWAAAANSALPIRVVLHGLQGAVTVKGQRFNSVMPAYGTAAPMTDAEVAAVLTYVRSSWGNKASAVTAAEVASERSATASHSGPWTAKDLQPLGGH